METRAEVLKRPEYWFEAIQNDLYEQVALYMEAEELNQTELAKVLGYSKGYISQILNGHFNHSIKKLIDLSVKIGKVPVVSYQDIDEIISRDEKSKILMSKSYESLPMPFYNGTIARDNTEIKPNIKINYIDANKEEIAV
ncbi:transcriptional regulator with XRE-family HTH domain [Mucilaginibacter sp. SG538B]|uniref:helix-turn-helix domain-containing protein n=1 Tax=Mucilaginibacter sp. SG538B TaxID=2587021 RepID=UPI00159E2E74|nr:helix-turn-helix transcriptional regulator [Mucilaginibacter sp. SG538B]NVM62001.1 transcriptional regulator with XRE-family HTH domain [Mucilaginibacter sp. SG538B]